MPQGVPEAPPIQLIVRETGRVIPLARGVSLSLGRTASCDIQIDDESVSRRHCTLALDGDHERVTDLGSANGTFVNDTAVGSAAARPGDTLRIGRCVLDVSHRAGAARRGPEPARGNAVQLESVIQKRFEPAGFEWLTSETAAGVDVALLDPTLADLVVELHSRTLLLPPGWES